MSIDPWGRPEREGIWTEIVKITPEMAHGLLAHNQNNRLLSPSHIDTWCGILERGEVMLTGESIKLARGDFRLLDGQHRLNAVIKTGIAAEFMIVWGLEHEAQDAMDRQKKRNLGDALRMRGEHNTARLAGSLNLIFAYVETGTLDTRRVNPAPTTTQLLNFFHEHEQLRDFMNPPYVQHVNTLLTPSLASSLYYLFHLVNPDDAYLFFEVLGTGAGVGDREAVRVLRERLIKERQKNQGRMDILHKSAYSIKAFNLWRAGVQVQALRWAGGGTAPEPFPRINECPLIPKPDRIKARR